MPRSWKVALSLVFVVACGGPLHYKLASTAKAPGADVDIKADVKSEQHLTGLEVAIEHMPPPGSVSAGATKFVMWGRRNAHGAWTRIGDLQYDDSSRKGEFQGTYPEVEFDFEVTPEKDDSAASPSPEVVVAQHIGPA